MKYMVDYWYRDHRYGQEQRGTYHTDSLTDVCAFTAMVKFLGGWSKCDLHVIPQVDREVDSV